MSKRQEKVVLAECAGRGVFENLSFRKLRNGNKIRIIIECEFDEQQMGRLASLLEKHIDFDFKEYVPEPIEDASQEKLEFAEGDASKN